MTWLTFFGYWGLILVGFVGGWSLRSILALPQDET